MESNDIIQEIRDVLKQTKSNGHETISIDAMDNYLVAFTKDIKIENYLDSQNHEKAITEFKANNDRIIANLNNQNAAALEMFKSVFSAGQSALRSSMIINGGAAAALLAFTGNIWNTSTSSQIANSLTSSIAIFCLGVLFAAIASGTTYLTQFSYSSNWKKIGHILNIVSIMVVMSSYALFCYGSIKSATTLGAHFAL